MNKELTSDKLSLPSGWEMSTLGELGKVSMCKRVLKKQTSPTGDIPFYKIGTFGKAPNAFISKEIYDEFRSKYSFPKVGDVLLSASGTIGRRVIFDGKPAYFQDSNIVWIDNDGKNVLNEFLYKFYGFCDWNPSKGATISRLYNDDLRKIKICYPNAIDEQRRIVSILDKSFAAINIAKANAEQNLQNAKELFESYLQGVFENKGDDWEDTSLKKEIDLATGFAFKSKNYTNSEKDILLLRGDNIVQGDFRWKDAKRWDKSEYDDFDKYQLQENDIVLAMDRPWVKAGLKCARVSKRELPSLLVQRTARLRSNSLLDNSFLYFLIQSKGFTDYLISAQTGIGVPHISGKQILSFSFRKPHLKKQQQIVKKLNSLSAETKKLATIYQQKIADLEEMKKSILNKAFKGEL